MEAKLREANNTLPYDITVWQKWWIFLIIYKLTETMN